MDIEFDMFVMGNLKPNLLNEFLQFLIYFMMKKRKIYKKNTFFDLNFSSGIFNLNIFQVDLDLSFDLLFLVLTILINNLI